LKLYAAELEFRTALQNDIDIEAHILAGLVDNLGTNTGIYHDDAFPITASYPRNRPKL